MSVKILLGDCRVRLRELSGQSVQTCVTSPPYFGLRDYGMADQIGLEQTPDAFVAELVAVFREVRRVLRDDGTLWLNLGDSYAANQSNNGGYSAKSTLAGFTNPNTKGRQANDAAKPRSLHHGLKPKDLIGIPWRVAFALQADGWYLRQDIIWHKPNPMPESVNDRCTKAHEYIFFLLSKSGQYYYDAASIEEPAKWERWGDQTERKKHSGTAGHLGGKTLDELPIRDSKNRRSVWTVPTKPYSGAHFATFPPDLIEPCIKAGSKAGDLVLDPFGGAGTTGLVADRMGRSAVLCELNPEYAKMAHDRIAGDAPALTEVTTA